MKTADLVLEFLITGSIGLLLIILLCATAGWHAGLLPAFPDEPFAKAIASALALPGIYYLGIGVHHASWWIWRRLFHRRRFAQLFKKARPRREHAAMRELAGKAYELGGSPLGDDPGWEATVEWCRFAILQYGSEAARQEYARQYHLYRVAYGPLSALGLAFLFASIRVAYEPSLWWMPLILLVTLLLLGHAAWQRGGRMWKSLCYSSYIALERSSRESGKSPEGMPKRSRRRRTPRLQRTAGAAR
jgi:hypothetical protein